MADSQLPLPTSLAPLEDASTSSNPDPQPALDNFLDLSNLAPTVPDLTFSALSRSRYQPDSDPLAAPALSLDLGPTGLSVTFDDERSGQSSKPSLHSPLSPIDEKSGQLNLDSDPRGSSRRWASLTEFGKSVMRGQDQKTSSLYHRPTFGSASHLKRRLSDIRSTAPSVASSTRQRLSLFRPWSQQSSHSPPGSPERSPSADTIPTLPPMSELLDSSPFEEDEPEEQSPVMSPALEAAPSPASTDKTPPTSATDTLAPPTDHPQSHRATSLVLSKSQPVMPSHSLSQPLDLKEDAQEPRPVSLAEVPTKAADSEPENKMSWRKPSSVLKHFVKSFTCKSVPGST